jgi:hypothetical protein
MASGSSRRSWTRVPPTPSSPPASRASSAPTWRNVTHCSCGRATTCAAPLALLFRPAAPGMGAASAATAWIGSSRPATRWRMRLLISGCLLLGALHAACGCHARPGSAAAATAAAALAGRVARTKASRPCASHVADKVAAPTTAPAASEGLLLVVRASVVPGAVLHPPLAAPWGPAAGRQAAHRRARCESSAALACVTPPNGGNAKLAAMAGVSGLRPTPHRGESCSRRDHGLTVRGFVCLWSRCWVPEWQLKGMCDSRCTALCPWLLDNACCSHAMVTPMLGRASHLSVHHQAPRAPDQEVWFTRL